MMTNGTTSSVIVSANSVCSSNTANAFPNTTPRQQPIITTTAQECTHYQTTPHPSPPQPSHLDQTPRSHPRWPPPTYPKPTPAYVPHSSNSYASHRHPQYGTY